MPQAGRGKPKGLPKSGGRKKGTLNSRTLAALGGFDQQLADLAFVPLAEVVKIARDPKTPVGDKLRACVTLLEYQHPKRKAIEITAPSSSAPALIVNVISDGTKPDSPPEPSIPKP